MKKKLFAVLLCLSMTAGLLPYAAWAAEPEHRHCVCGLETAADANHTHSKGTKWVGITSLDEITAEHSRYYLKNNVFLSESWRPRQNIELCLNGYSLVGTTVSDTIRKTEDCTLVLTDCSENETGKITHSKGGGGRGISNEKGTLTLWRGSVCGNIKNSAGAGVVNAQGATFNLYGGSVANNVTTDYGQGAGVYNRGTLTMSGGQISGNYAGASGGGIFNYGGTVQISGTAIIRNNRTSPDNSSAYGGGIENSLGTLTITGGEISGNSSNCGGGVYNEANANSSPGKNAGSFTMTGGEIKGNSAKVAGGGIYNIANGDSVLTVTIAGNALISENDAKNGGGIGANGAGVTLTVAENAKIKNNTAADAENLSNGDGGGVFLRGDSYSGYSTFIMAGGEICGNSARRGGGIYKTARSGLRMEGGALTDNTALNGGGGVWVLGEGTVLKNTVKITGNTLSDGSANNLYLNTSSSKVSAAGLSDGAQIGVSAPIGAELPFVLSTDTMAKNYFVSDAAGIEAVLNADGYAVLEEKTERYTVKLNLPADGSANLTDRSGAREQTVKAGSRDYKLVELRADEFHYFSAEDIDAMNAALNGSGIYVATIGKSETIKITGTPVKNIEATVRTTAKKSHAAPRVWGEAPDSPDGRGYIYGIASGMEYRKAGSGEWTDCGYLNYIEAEAGATYQVRYKGSLTDLASPATDVTVPAYSAPKVPNPAPCSYIYDGAEHTGVPLGADYVISSGINTATEAGSYVVYLKPATGKEWADGTVDAKPFAWKIEKAEQKAPAALAGVKPSTAGAADGKIIGVSAEMEYRRAGTLAWTACADSEIMGLAAGSYEVRYKERRNYNAGAAFTVTVPAGDLPVFELRVLSGTGSGSYEQGATVTITANVPAEGKAFDKWVIRRGDASVTNAGEPTAVLTMGSGSAVVEATYRNDYRIIEGANGSRAQSSENTLTFRANGAFAAFVGVQVDGKDLAAGSYTAVSGSTVVTLASEYLDGLSVGMHTLTVVYSDGACSTTFEIKAPHAHSYAEGWSIDAENHWHACECGDTTDKAAHTFAWKIDKASSKTEDGRKHEECTVCGAKRSENTVIEKLSKSGEETPLTPKTGDGSHVLRWAVLLAVSGGALSGTVLLGKKKKDS